MLTNSRLRVAWFLPAALVALSGVADLRPVPAADEPALVFSLHFSEGMPGAPTRETSSGSVMAGWDDGVVVFARNPQKAGQDMLFGRLTQAELERVMSDISEAGFFDDLPGGGIAPDASYFLLWAKDGGKSAHHRCMWDPDRFGPLGSRARADEPERKFARMWALSRVALSFAYPDTQQPLDSDPQMQRRLRKSGSSYYVQVHVNEGRP